VYNKIIRKEVKPLGRKKEKLSLKEIIQLIIEAVIAVSALITALKS